LTKNEETLLVHRFYDKINNQPEKQNLINSLVLEVLLYTASVN
jgi:hypothetical protein